MWISDIELKNFKSYQEAKFEFLEPKDGKNIVIIGAKNGHGKTTLLEALYLGLYNEDAISHLERAGLNEKKSVTAYLNSALYKNAEPIIRGQYCMQTIITLKWRDTEHNLQGIKISRKWWFDGNRQVIINNNETNITQFDGYFAVPLDDDDMYKIMQAHALPVDYAPFFFFDGEKIINIARAAQAGDWLNKAFRGLTGVVLLEQLKMSLHDYKTQYIKALSTKKTQDKLDELERQLHDIHQKLAQADHDRQQAIDKKMALTQEYDSLVQVLGQGQDIKTTQVVLDQIQKIDNQHEVYKNKLKSAIKAMPMALLPKNDIDKLIIKLEREKNRLEHEAGKEQIEGKVDEFWQSFVKSDKVREVLGRSADSILNDELMKQAVKECWELLYYPLPEGCADTITHNYLSQTIHSKIIAEYVSIKQNQLDDSLSHIVHDIDELERLQKTLNEELDNLKSDDNDSKVERFKEIADELEDLNQKIGLYDGRLNEYQSQQHSIKSAQDKYMDEMSEDNPKVLKANRAKIIESFIDKLTQELIATKIYEISKTATDINAKIAHNAIIAHIKVAKDGKITLYNKDGMTIKSDLSAGQLQVLMMSLITAMAEVTDYQMPFVIDTPLARLDSEHRHNIFKHWQSLDRQIILLSQDTEVTPEVAKQLAPSINKTYLVVSDGTTAQVTADIYF